MESDIPPDPSASNLPTRNPATRPPSPSTQNAATQNAATQNAATQNTAPSRPFSLPTLRRRWWRRKFLPALLRSLGRNLNAWADRLEDRVMQVTTTLPGELRRDWGARIWRWWLALGVWLGGSLGGWLGILAIGLIGALLTWELAGSGAIRTFGKTPIDDRENPIERPTPQTQGKTKRQAETQAKTQSSQPPGQVIPGQELPRETIPGQATLGPETLGPKIPNTTSVAQGGTPTAADGTSTTEVQGGLEASPNPAEPLGADDSPQIDRSAPDIPILDSLSLRRPIDRPRLSDPGQTSAVQDSVFWDSEILELNFYSPLDPPEADSSDPNVPGPNVLGSHDTAANSGAANSAATHPQQPEDGKSSPGRLDPRPPIGPPLPPDPDRVLADRLQRTLSQWLRDQSDRFPLSDASDAALLPNLSPANPLVTVHLNRSQQTLQLTLDHLWYRLTPEQQDQWLTQIQTQSRHLNLKRWELRDSEHHLLARSAVVGPQFLVFRRYSR
ncbi:MAG: hypothetical protein ACO4AI_07030 [Prochlorothrix sp.]